VAAEARTVAWRGERGDGAATWREEDAAATVAGEEGGVGGRPPGGAVLYKPRVRGGRGLAGLLERLTQ
jgi:hypothetical protein